MTGAPAALPGRFPAVLDHRMCGPHVRAALLAGRACQAAEGAVPPASAGGAGPEAAFACCRALRRRGGHAAGIGSPASTLNA